MTNPALEKLKVAIQEFASSLREEAVLVDTAILVWEEIHLDEKGEAGRSISYAVPTDNFSTSSALGLLEAGTFLVRRDTLKAQD